MYSLVVAVGIIAILFFALSPVIAFCYWLPSRLWGVILTGVLLSFWLPDAPGVLILLITAAFGLFVWRKTRQDYRLS